MAGDRVYPVSHSRYGDMKIFMIRGAAKRLEAVFN